MLDLEPIARAMAESLPPAETISNAEWAKAKTTPYYPEFEGMARAVYLATLKAIRDLDNEALEAVGAMDNHEGYHTSDDDHRRWFTAMIDHMIEAAGDE